jgi:hypothetical protein
VTEYVLFPSALDVFKFLVKEAVTGGQSLAGAVGESLVRFVGVIFLICQKSERKRGKIREGGIPGGSDACC